MATKKKEKTDWRVICVGMVCVTIAEIFALYQGINGTIFSGYMLMMGGLAGNIIPSPIKK